MERRSAVRQARRGQVGEASNGWAPLGKARQARHGVTRSSVERCGKAGFGMAGGAGKGAAGVGLARQRRHGNTKTKGAIMATKKAVKEEQTTTASVVISRPNILTGEFRIVGTAPYVQHKFSDKARKIMLDKQKEGSTAKSKRGAREQRKPEEDYEAATHFSSDGWCGIPAPGFRNAMIDACRLVGFKMTIGKQSIFIDADGIDSGDGTPLVRIDGDRELHEGMVRLPTGVADVRIRPMWRQWSATLRVKFDGDQFSLTDVSNLLMRAGLQVGIGEGRPFSKNSTGLGWGTFEIVEEERKAA